MISIVYASGLGALLATGLLRTLGVSWGAAFLISVFLAAGIGFSAADAVGLI